MANGGGEHDLNGFIERVEQAFARFDERFSNVEKLQAEQGARIGNLLEQQSGVFARINRPFQWAALGVAVAIISFGVTLVIAPIVSEQQRQHGVDEFLMRALVDQARHNGAGECDLDWLKRLEERQNDRLHGALSRAQ